MIALVDCNNFFASCERLFRPDLTDRPVLVLSNNDGCVVARSNEVKALGIPMAVPYFKVRDIVEKNKVHCFSSNFALYSNISQRIVGVLQKHVPQIEVYSIDEAFMDLDPLPTQDFITWGNNLRHEIQTSIGMPVSIGIAPTKTLAKLASSYAKQHKQACLLDPMTHPRTYKKILSETEIGKLWGIGWRTAPKLTAMGVRTAWQLAQVSEKWVQAQLGINGTRLLRELRGQAAYPFEEDAAPQKSLMASRSFGHTVKNIHDLETAVASFASQAAYRLRGHEQQTGLFGVYLRFKTKDGSTKSQTAVINLSTPTNDTSQLVSAALTLMEQLYDTEHGYKKAGVFAYHLTSANICQTNLFDTQTPADKQKRQNLMASLDEINHRFGSNTIYIASINPASTKWKGLKKRMSPAYVTDWAQLPKLYGLTNQTA